MSGIIDLEVLEKTKHSGSIGFVETRYFTFANPPDELILDSVEKLGPITLAYETYGKINNQKSNK